ncbi:hypothetical protein CRUP_029198, partial [Coryphaenoides rupestris]
MATSASENFCLTLARQRWTHNAAVLCCAFPSRSRRIINLSPVMVIPEEQPAQPALPVQPEGLRVVCGHCGNTFL